MKEIKTFPDNKYKQRELITTRTDLQEMLKGFFQVERTLISNVKT